MSHARHTCPHCGHDHTKLFDYILRGFGNWHAQSHGRERCPDCTKHIEWEIADLERKDDEILRLERLIVVGMSATGFALTQIRQPRAGQGVEMIDPTKNGVAPGTTGWFQYSTLPIGSKLKPGAPVSVTSGDKSISFAPSLDGDPTKFGAVVDAAETLPTFGITIAGTSLDGTPISSTFTIPVLPAGSTGGTPATGFDLIQLASKPLPPGGSTSISATPSSISGTVGDAPTQLKVVDDQGNDVTATSTYASADLTVATVDASGLVTLVGQGTTSINVTNGSLTTSVSVTSAAAAAAPANPPAPAN